MSIMFIDLEVQNHPYYGAVASPRHPDNYVVLAASAIDNTPYDGEIKTIVDAKSKEDVPKEWLIIPDDVWLIVAHNASFEIDWFLSCQREALEKFFARGGRVFCTQLGHYLLSNQQDKYPSLDEVAPQYGGSHKVDGVKILWEQGVLTADIERSLLLEYLVGPEGDIANTRKVFYGEYSELSKRGMWDMALARMDALMYNAYCMHNGMHIDTEVANAQLKEQEAKLALLSDKFKGMREGMPEEVEFKETSDYHMSAWLYGGSIKYRVRVPRTDTKGNLMYEKVDMYRCEVDPDVYYSVEDYEKSKGAYPVMKYKSGKNKGLPKLFKVETSTVQTKWGEALYKCKPIIDLNKFPKEFSTAFLQEYSGKRLMPDGSPVVSSGGPAVQDLMNRPELPEETKEFLQELIEYAALDKDIGTYYLRHEYNADGSIRKTSGMLQYVTPQNIIHHSLNAVSTSTTRLSSTRPNLQNVSTGRKSSVQNVFNSRFGDQGVILSADYSALEVVVLQVLSGDSNLKKALLDGIDMHCLRLSANLKEDYTEVYHKCHTEDHPEHSKYAEARQNIKAPAFAYQYGATAFGIAYTTGCTVEEAQAFIDNEKKLFPEVEAWYNDVVFREVQDSTKLKAHREMTPEGTWKLFHTGTYTAPDGTTWSFREYPKTIYEGGQSIDVMQFKPTQMRNYPVQGTAAFFVQLACGWVFRNFIRKNHYNGKAFMVNTIHDAIYVDVHKDVVLEVAQDLKYLMEYIPKGAEAYGYNIEVPFPVEVSVGHSMGEQKTLDLTVN